MDTLSGKSEGVTERISDEMNAAAERLDFERAAALRDQLKAIEYITREHKAVSPGFADQDVIALARDDGDAVVQILFIRNGKLIGSDSRTLDGAEDENDAEVLGEFLKRFYGDSAEVPPEIVLPQNIEEARIIERWLKDRRSGKRVTITVPQRGDKRHLIDIAKENADETLHMLRAQWEADTLKQESALGELQKALNLPTHPQPHRVLRHQHDAGHGDCRQPGGVRAWACPRKPNTAASTSAPSATRDRTITSRCARR